MSLSIQIQKASENAENFVELVKRLISLGITSYTVDVKTGLICYRYGMGLVTITHPCSKTVLDISEAFNGKLVKEAIKNNQQGKSDYTAFMKEIAAAGVYFYEVVLTGNSKRVIYIGIYGYLEEPIPI